MPEYNFVRSRTLGAQEPCPRSSRGLTPRIGRARRALSTPHLQIRSLSLETPQLVHSLLGRLTRCRRKPAAEILFSGSATLSCSGQWIQARRGCRPDARDSPGAPAAPLALKLTNRAAQSRARAERALSCCQSAPVRVYPSPWFLSNSSRGSFLRGFFPLAV